MKKDEIKVLLDEKAEYRDKLFARGFLFSDEEYDRNEYPFYCIWNYSKIDKYNLYVSPKQNSHTFENDSIKLVMIGHAYDPIEHISKESVILSGIANQIQKPAKFWERINNLTGVFTLIWLFDNKVYVTGDATCMQTCFYTNLNEHIHISSHTALLGDLLSLEEDPYVTRLKNYRFFPLLGNALPGDLSPYSEVKRMVPNHYVCFTSDGSVHTKRFYTPHTTSMTMEAIEKRVAELLHENMELIPEKWQKPAISMTGGCDSKTTMACAVGLYDKYSYFSYESSESERVDAVAAAKIAEALGIKHNIYIIPSEDSDVKDIEVIRTILDHNSGDVIGHNKNDVRKRAFFADTEDFDVEVKSWVSEIGRSYYSKRFNGRIKFGDRPTPRKCTTMYKFFLHNRRLVCDTDDVFRKYLKKYFKADDVNPVEWQEQFFWEYRVPSWNGLVITGEHRYSYDITIPYNNRILLNLLLSMPIKDRIADTLYANVRTMMNPVIDQTGIAVQNLKHTKRREKFENLYYTMHSMFPF